MAYRGLIAGNKNCNYTLPQDAGPGTSNYVLTSDGAQHITLAPLPGPVPPSSEWTNTTAVCNIFQDASNIGTTDLNIYYTGSAATFYWALYVFNGIQTGPLVSATQTLTIVPTDPIVRPLNPLFYDIITTGTTAGAIVGQFRVTTTGAFDITYPAASILNPEQLGIESLSFLVYGTTMA